MDLVVTTNNDERQRSSSDSAHSHASEEMLSQVDDRSERLHP